LDLKTVLSDFCGQSLVCELILALVSLWLLVNSFKETFKEKQSIDFFDYFIIIFAFFDLTEVTAWTIGWIFILTVIKQDYNTNDQLKFNLSIIRRDNDLNKR